MIFTVCAESPIQGPLQYSTLAIFCFYTLPLVFSFFPEFMHFLLEIVNQQNPTVNTALYLAFSALMVQPFPPLHKGHGTQTDPNFVLVWKNTDHEFTMV